MDHVPMPPDVKAGMQDRSITITALPYAIQQCRYTRRIKKKKEIPTAKTPVAPRIDTGIRQEPSGGDGQWRSWTPITVTPATASIHPALEMEEKE
jgi:hypothetical protein